MRFVRESYDAQYFDSLGDRLPFYRDIINRRMANLVRSSGTPGRLLELGCGDGRLLAALADDYDVTGIDISEHAIARARRRIPHGRLLVGDVTECPQDSYYDMVLALNLLEHLPDPAALMRRVGEMLSEGGKFVFSVPNKYGPIGKAFVALMNRFDRTHISTYTRERWLSLASSLGFEQLRVLNATWFGPTYVDFAKYFAPILVVVLYKHPVAEEPEPASDIDVALALAEYPELITGAYE